MKKNNKKIPSIKQRERAWMKKREAINGTLDLKPETKTKTPLPQSLIVLIVIVTGLMGLVGLGWWKYQMVTNEKMQTARLVMIEEKRSKELNTQKEYWNDIVKIQPSYVPGLIRLTIINWEMGNKSQAKEFLEKVRSIDPNHKDLRQIEELMKEG